MKSHIVAAAFLCLAVVIAKAQDKVTEPSTGTEFEVRTVFPYGGTDYTQQLTGVAVRKKLVFKVYSMAHYMQDPPTTTEEGAFEAILKDGKAKQIVMTFVRDVDKQKIQDAYHDGFKE